MINNPILKLWYKITNKYKYQNYKHEQAKISRIKHYNEKVYDNILNIQKKIESKKELSFLHSGHTGDLIYSLAAIKELSKTHICKLYIEVNKEMTGFYGNHPSGKYFLDERIVKLLLPLVKSQKFLQTAQVYNNEDVDIDLNLFRDIPINIRFHSTRWYAHLTGVHFNMNEPFIDVDEHESIKGKIVINRSPRYRNEYIKYNFLKDTKNILCIGLKSEFDNLKKEIHNLEFYDSKDFLEMAQIIKSSKFFIGNECFAYSVAEGLKIPRLLEASPDFPVVFPSGNNGYDFYHQNHFEKFFDNFNKL